MSSLTPQSDVPGVLTEPMSCLMWGLNRGFEPAPIGSEILLTGAGIIGNLWTAVLHHRGHRKVTVVEPSGVRRELNKRLGEFPERCSSSKNTELAQLLEIFEPSLISPHD